MDEWKPLPNGVRPVPQQRIRDKVDAYMRRRDYPAVERHLLYWLEEARQGRDERGMLMILNELVGHYRKTGERDRAMACADQALELLDRLDFSGTISEGTTCVNIATAMSAFSENLRAMAVFASAQAVYEASPDIDPGLLGGLYNNMALNCAALRRWDAARGFYDKALECMARTPHGELEQAITWLNLADLEAAQHGMEAGERAIYACLDRAASLLEHSDAPRDGYFAFVCEKCAPSFEYYGYFVDAERLRQEAERIYEGT
jgi:tetratricopeptide (TPR) repeat protein